MRYLLRFTILLLFCVIFSCSKEETWDVGYIASVSRDGLASISISGVNYEVPSYHVFAEEDCIRFYRYYRIPSITITNQKDILVVCENRLTYQDLGEMDVLLSRKESNSQVWEISRIWRNDDTTFERSMNPVFIVDRLGAFGTRGGIFLFSCHIKHDAGLLNYAKTDEVDIVYKYSSDDGNNWSVEQSIKNSCDFSEYDIIVPSAANGIQLHDGTIVLPTMIGINEEWHSGIAYIKPDGDWFFSKPTPRAGDNECTVYTDNNERLVLDCRTMDYKRRKYIYDFTNNDWRLEAEISVNLNLKAEIVHYVINNRDIYLTCFCDSPSRSRDNITLYGSKDGTIWTKICLLQSGFCQGGYTTLALYDDMLYVVHETNNWGIRVLDLSSLGEVIVDEIYKH